MTPPVNYLQIFCGDYNDDAVYILVTVGSPSSVQKYELWGGGDELSRLSNILSKLSRLKISESISFSIGSFQSSYAGDVIKINFQKNSDDNFLIEFEGQLAIHKDKGPPDLVTFQVEKCNLDRFFDQVKSIRKESGVALLE